MSYLIRLDDRLVHGQVVEGWIKPLKISLIVICSDTVACDIMQKTLFNLSVPPHVKLECETIKDTAVNIVKRRYDKENVLILVSSLKDLNTLVDEILALEKDFVLEKINVGGIRHCGNKKQIYRALCLDNEDVEILKKLISKNVVLEYYILPNDNKINLNTVIPEIEKSIK
jgi:mannose/fructose/N-acetylgalactosamine-specific phosphotransferase system component IIB